MKEYESPQRLRASSRPDLTCGDFVVNPETPAPKETVAKLFHQLKGFLTNKFTFKFWLTPILKVSLDAFWTCATAWILLIEPDRTQYPA